MDISLITIGNAGTRDSDAQARMALGLRILTEAYQQARQDGLCQAGAWEFAQAHIQGSDREAILRLFQFPESDR